MLTRKNFLTTALTTLFALVAITASAQSTESGRFLSLSPPGGLPIIPVLEGWIDNQDGTTSFSFGIINRNDEAVEIPLGEGNRIEPGKWDGIQPTHFPAGRSTGVFTVTVPNAERETDVWWYLKTGDNEELKVPGRYGGSAYELDFIRPRPQGALARRRGPAGRRPPRRPRGCDRRRSSGTRAPPSRWTPPGSRTGTRGPHRCR